MPPLRNSWPAAALIAAIAPACSTAASSPAAASCNCAASVAAAPQNLPSWVPARNFVALDATVAGAGAPPLAAIAGMPADGYGALIDLRLPSEPGHAEERAAAEAAGLRWISVPVTGSNFDLADAAALRAALADAGDAKVLLHCRSGSRVGALWALMQAVDQGLTPEEAEQLARASGAAPALATRVRALLLEVRQ